LLYWYKSTDTDAAGAAEAKRQKEAEKRQLKKEKEKEKKKQLRAAEAAAAAAAAAKAAAEEAVRQAGTQCGQCGVGVLPQKAFNVANNLFCSTACVAVFRKSSAKEK
jgi:peptidoglycan hydrolase CwlO-like protein